MPMGRLAMRHVRDVMRLKAAGLSIREIGRRVGAVPSTVRQTIRRFAAAGLSWPLADDITDAVLEERLFAGAGTKPGQRRRAEPDWAAIHRELKRKHVTLSILWEEYIASEPDGYRYSRYVAARFMLPLP
jgi:transposase